MQKRFKNAKAVPFHRSTFGLFSVNICEEGREVKKLVFSPSRAFSVLYTAQLTMTKAVTLGCLQGAEQCGLYYT